MLKFPGGSTIDAGKFVIVARKKSLSPRSMASSLA